MQNQQAMESQSFIVVYNPTPLRSMNEICQATGVGEKTIKLWICGGAPIAVEGKGSRARYSAELASLLSWRHNKSKEVD